MNLTPETLEEIRLHFCRAYPNEGCGLILKDGTFVGTDNVAEDPSKFFTVPDADYYRHEDNLAAIVHSHSMHDVFSPRDNWDHRTPSGMDIQVHIATGVPMGITICDGQGIDPFIWLGESHLIPLVGREFIHGFTDCYAACRDWYKIERGIEIPEFPRDMSWWTQEGKNLYMEGFEKAGFTVIPAEDVKVGDAVLMQVASRVVNHAGVITDTDEIFHHLYGRLSCHEPLSKYSKGVEVYVRHKDLNQEVTT